MSISLACEKSENNIVKIKVVGVGGGGCNVVTRMSEDGPADVDYIAINTDKMSLDATAADYRVQIGEKLTKGQGSGADPTVGRKSAEESRSQIAKGLEGADMVFITAGMGGGTGTGAAPVVAEIAREAGILTVGVVTKPFSFEGRRRMVQANKGIEELYQKVDSLVIISNDRIKLASNQSVTFANAFRIADDVLRQALISISNLIRNTGFINLDFADVKAIMKDAGLAHMGVGQASGKGKAETAACLAISSTLMETSIHAARGILIDITGSVDIGLEEVEEAAATVQKSVHRDANIIFGAAFDEKMEDEIRVTVIATGFEPKETAREPEQRLERPAKSARDEKTVREDASTNGMQQVFLHEKPIQEIREHKLSEKMPEMPKLQNDIDWAAKQPADQKPTPTEAFYGMLDDIVQSAKHCAFGSSDALQPAIQRPPDGELLIESAKDAHDDISDLWEPICRMFRRREQKQ